MTTTPTVWKAQHQLNFTDAADQFAPAVVAIGSGRYVVAWTEAFGTAVAPEPGSDVVGQIFDALGNRVGAEFRLNLSFSDGNESSPALATAPGGGFVVLYHDLDTDGTSIRMQRFDVSGTVVMNPPTTILQSGPSGEYANPSIAMRPDGSALISYEQNDESLLFLFLRADGTLLGGGLTPSADRTGGEVAAISNGAYAIVYEHQDEGGLGGEIYFALVNQPGYYIGFGVEVAPHGADDPQVAALRGGGFVVVWESHGVMFDRRAQDIFAKVFDNHGSPVSAVIPVNILNADGNQNLPDVAALDDGGFVVIWRDEATTTVRGQRFGPTGDFIGTEFMAATGTGPQLPTISTLSDGRFMVAFQRPDGDSDVYGTIFDPRDSSYNGTGGNDVITARIDGATINALGGNDQLLGQGGPDRFTGGAGNDTLGGAGGADVAVYAGARANYQVHTFKAAGGVVTRVKDGAGSDGNDFLTGIETLVFAGANVTRFGAQSNLIANVDGARFDDVVFRSTVDGQIIFQNMANGAATGFGAITAPLTSAWKALGTGDVNTDAKADVLVWNSSSGQVLVASPGGAGTPAWSVLANGFNGAYAALGVSDINGDGYTDLLVRHVPSGTIYWQNSAAPAQWGVVGTNLGSAWTYQAAGDVNGDGFADVVIQNTSGLVYAANMANGVNSGYIDLGNIAGHAVRTVADVNGDGLADVIVQNTANGQTLWRDFSGSGAPWKVASDPVGTGWIVRNGADVDNDTSVDLIYQHATTGETIYRAMDNGVATGWGTVSTPLGEWVVV